MEERRSTGRSKRHSKTPDEGFWDCSVCTYRNPPEAFKCEMCDVRKGTSTRKPRINSQMVAQQVAQQFAPLGPPKKEKLLKEKKHSPGSSKRRNRPPRLKNVDRSTASHMAVTVGSVTVVITDYQPKDRRTSSEATHSNHEMSDSSDSASFTATNDNDPDDQDITNEHEEDDKPADEADTELENEES